MKLEYDSRVSTLIDQILNALETSRESGELQHALLCAALLFEKENGLAPCGWPPEVLESNFSVAELARLKDAMVRFVNNGGCGSWALGKCNDPALKNVLVDVLRRSIDTDPDELYQAMIALDNLGEDVFNGRCSNSPLHATLNRESARAYLERQDRRYSR